MKRKVKSYLVFTSLVYRVVMYLLMPAAIVGLCLWMERDFGGVALLLPALLLIMVEVASDSWLFGGIQTKNFDKMDYLKTSRKGMGVLRNALCMDLLRKFLAALGVLTVCCVAMRLWCGAPRLSSLYDSDGMHLGGPGTEAGILLYYVLVSYFFSALGTFLSRYGSLFWLNTMIGYVAMTPALFCMILLPGLLQYIFLYDLLFAVLSACVSFVTVRAAMKKTEGSFYDQ